MPVIQGTKKGKAKMKGSNTQKCSAGKKKKGGKKGAEITTSPKSGASRSPLFRVDAADSRGCVGAQGAPGAGRAVAFPRSSFSWQGWRALLISQARHVEHSLPALLRGLIITQLYTQPPTS